MLRRCPACSVSDPSHFDWRDKGLLQYFCFSSASNKALRMLVLSWSSVVASGKGWTMQVSNCSTEERQKAEFLCSLHAAKFQSIPLQQRNKPRMAYISKLDLMRERQEVGYNRAHPSYTCSSKHRGDTVPTLISIYRWFSESHPWLTKISVQALLHIQFKVEGGEEAGAILLVSDIIGERSNDGENLKILMNENKKCKQETIEMRHAMYTQFRQRGIEYILYSPAQHQDWTWAWCQYPWST